MHSSDFEIRDGKLIRYTGNAPEVRIPSEAKAIALCAFGTQSRHGSVKKLVIPETVEVIEHSAFAYCPHLTEIVFEAKPKALPYGLFRECTSLRSVRLPDSVEVIGAEAFYGCCALEAVILPRGLHEIGELAFYGCTALTRISLPPSLRTLGNGAFHGCRALYDVRIAVGLLSVGSHAFSECESLTELRFPVSVTKIGDRAFTDCKRLTHVAVCAEELSLGRAVFNGVPSSVSVDFGGDARAWEAAIRPIYTEPEYETMYGERGSYTKDYPLGHADGDRFVCHVQTKKDGRILLSYGTVFSEDGGIMH